MPGVRSAVVGYTGGTSGSKPPTYASVSRGDGYTEAVRVTFDPEIVSFEEICRIYFATAAPTRWQLETADPSWPPVALRAATKGKHALWYQSDFQRTVASRVAVELKSGVPVLEATDWYDAEERHRGRPPKEKRPTAW